MYICAYFLDDIMKVKVKNACEIHFLKKRIIDRIILHYDSKYIMKLLSKSVDSTSVH